MGWLKFDINKCKWRPDKWGYERKKEILAKISKARSLLAMLSKNVSNEELDTHETYGRVYDIMEELYNDIEIGKLTEDYLRRKKEVDDRLRKRGLKGK